MFLELPFLLMVARDIETPFFTLCAHTHSHIFMHMYTSVTSLPYTFIHVCIRILYFMYIHT